jgi:hypothetical protein
VQSAGAFTITGTLLKPTVNATVHLKVNGQTFTKKAEKSERLAFPSVQLSAGPVRIEAWLEDADGMRGVRFIEVRHDERAKE